MITRRLIHEHVKGRRREPARLERFEERLFVDDAASRSVDETRGRFHERQLSRADQVAVGVDKGNVDGDEVGPLEQVVQADELDIEQLGPLH